jgi:glycosyltransferase involved in cell wall biosynthesis
MLSSRKGILFVSDMGGDGWGGSEELWSQTALRLAAEGVPVFASMVSGSPLHPRVQNLMECGVEIRFRLAPSPLLKKGWRKLMRQNPTVAEVHWLIAAKSPGLVVLSNGGALPPVELAELCVANRLPFVNIGQANSEDWWPADEIAERYRTALTAAMRCYFVSKANRQLAEKQIGCELPNAEVVWNPFNVDFLAAPAWPPLAQNGALRLACVARLHPPSKGQDILFEVLAGSSWAARHWQLNLYGEGPMRDSLARLAQRLGLRDRIVFCGHVDPKEIWELNHVLIMPSRYEGLPVAMIEAMLCGRPVVATDVAGHSEVIEDGVTGFLAEAPTVGSMVRALERFWNRRADATAIGAAAREKIRQLVPPDPVRIFSGKIKEHVK